MTTEGAHFCKDHNRSFATAQGLTMHRTRAHKSEVVVETTEDNLLEQPKATTVSSGTFVRLVQNGKVAKAFDLTPEDFRLVVLKQSEYDTLARKAQAFDAMTIALEKAAVNFKG